MNHEKTHQTNPMAPWDPLDALLTPWDPLATPQLYLILMIGQSIALWKTRSSAIQKHEPQQ